MVMWGQDQPVTPSSKSVVVALAHRIFRDTVCRTCGQSTLLSHDPRNSGEFEIRTDVTCEGCVVVEQHQDSDRDSLPGEKAYVQNHMSDDLMAGG